MPTLGAHFPDDEAKIVENAAAVSPQEKTGPYIVEAVRQRLQREGLLPVNERAEVLAAIEEIGVGPALEVLRRASRRKGAQVRTVAA